MPEEFETKPTSEKQQEEKQEGEVKETPLFPEVSQFPHLAQPSSSLFVGERQDEERQDEERQDEERQDEERQDEERQDEERRYETELPFHVVEMVLTKTQVSKAIDIIREKGKTTPISSRATLSFSDNLFLNWGHSFLRTRTLWSYENNTLLGTGVKVAVLDTGIDPLHSDFRGAILAGRDFSGTGSWVDGHGHGSHCAGIIGARLNNGRAAGVSPNCRLLIGKVLDNKGSGSFSSITNGIVWATNFGANVISLSLGAQTTMPSSLRAAIDNAISKNVIVVVASGNEGRDGVSVPGSYTKCVTVGACRDQTGEIANFSSIGPSVDIVAPGVNIYSTYKNGSYAYMSGTSMATPFVAGVAALFVQACRILNVTPTQSLFEAYAQRTAIDRGISGKDSVYGYGCIAPLSIISNLYKYKSNPPGRMSSSSFPWSNFLNFKTRIFLPTDDFFKSSSQNHPLAVAMTTSSLSKNNNNNIPFGLNENHPSGLFIEETIRNHAAAHQLKLFKVKGVEDGRIFMRFAKGLLNQQETEEIIKLGKDRLVRSLVRTGDGKNVKDSRRTSQTGFFSRSETPLIDDIEKRVTSLFNLPQSFLEPIQILRYGKNEKYDAHYDASDDKYSSTVESFKFFENGYQRILSVFVYLSDSLPCKKHAAENIKNKTHLFDENEIPIAGKFKKPVCASTHFKNLDVSFSGKKGDAVIWTNTDATRKILKNSLHQGTPLCEGEKWALNFWIHSRDFS